MNKLEIIIGIILVIGGIVGPTAVTTLGLTQTTVTVTETGLPAGTAWSVEIYNGQSYQTFSSATNTIVATFSYDPISTQNLLAFYVPGFQIGNTQYAASPAAGNFAPGGSYTITFSANTPKYMTYSYTFEETGLKQGDSATLTVNGQAYTISASTPKVVINNLPDGSYQWSMSSSQGGATPSPDYGTISSSGTSVIAFAYSSTQPSIGVVLSASGNTLTALASIPMSSTPGYVILIYDLTTGNQLGVETAGQSLSVTGMAGNTYIAVISNNYLVGESLKTIGIVTESNPVSLSAPSSTYSYVWQETGLKAGDYAILTVNGQQYDLPNGTEVAVSGLSGSVQWSISNSQNGAVPSPSSGTVTGSGMTTVGFTYHSMANPQNYSLVQYIAIIAGAIFIADGARRAEKN
ncbi:MAG: hypothetical protein JRN26_04585 [Nitrososphaerota archaeon]|jgi:hypothetical protein|nr:hypothetical protein [Nitrososphaerota archaeon]MDG6927865.1 hypothetical protein [Nitrososphaerota archaeon]MDG6930840.1 hypothetical protein [Nitrososphaerota archaeon]MDG6932160.1 hypothetical protein [Nitrososphaerota archaeon]MDG6936141.1 hypothetical protein [Nitrososphaerota archaeon]